jgi:pimeloyl-ACP methyl ester carboxylesterase
MPTIECCGSTLFYHLTGAGPPVLLLHSSACRGGFWQGLIEHLGEGFSFYTPDLAGYGRSRGEPLRGKTTLRDEAEFIAPLLWHDTRRFHLIGHSFGGAVALAAALAWPDRVGSLTLYEPTTFSLLRGGSADDQALFETIAAVPTDMRKFRKSGSDDSAMGRFVDFWNGAAVWDRKPAGERATLCRLACKVIADFAMLFDAAWDADAFDRLRCPVLILRGDRSPAVAARVAEVLAARVGNARLQTIEGTGHMAPVSNPEPIAAAILDHLRRAGADAERSACRSSAAHELQRTGETSW